MRDVTAIGSRHVIYVTEPADLADVAGWPAETLFSVVEAADPLDRLVVLDYGRERLYAAADVAFDRPTVFGLIEPGELTVEDPLLVDLADGIEFREHERTVTVAPEFDVLVPAFEWVDEEVELLPPTDRRDRPSPSPHGTPT